KFIDPIHEYDRSSGLSITGGIHYRGKAVPELQGTYIYGDFVHGNIWALDFQNGKKTTNAKIFKRTKGSLKPTAFVEDANGELLILSHDHKIYTISPKK
ncbi:glucose sorbosone dehydrogenase, partial [Akkermansiaceae bacterium]|nr:glucose sorbosone dehydrogenase [Akkermansiaceae bacterium]